jgi:hypothetical protein
MTGIERGHIVIGVPTEIRLFLERSWERHRRMHLTAHLSLVGFGHLHLSWESARCSHTATERG